MEIAMCREGGCRPYTPVKEWAEELKKAGFTEGTIVGADRHLTGNLRAAFPRACVIDAAMPPEAFPATSTGALPARPARHGNSTRKRNIDQGFQVELVTIWLTSLCPSWCHQGLKRSLAAPSTQSSSRTSTQLYHQFGCRSEHWPLRLAIRGGAVEGLSADSSSGSARSTRASISISNTLR